MRFLLRDLKVNKQDPLVRHPSAGGWTLGRCEISVVAGDACGEIRRRGGRGEEAVEEEAPKT
jgi:hypothetical protein